MSVQKRASPEAIRKTSAMGSSGLPMVLSRVPG